MRDRFLIIGLFLILTVILTHPLILNMGHSIAFGEGDPLLNTWILGWDIHKLTTGLKNFWTTNMFYPENLTLAFSEHLIVGALIGLPIFILSKNIVLTYNFITLLSFLLSGLGAYFLVNYLVKNKWAGLIAGIIYAFAPFRFAQFGHIQIISAQWIPFCFLYLHKFFKTAKNKYLILFALFFLLQALTCNYYAAFLLLAVIIFILYYSVVWKKYIQKIFYFKLFLAMMGAGLVMLPFIWPYYLLQKNMGFARSFQEVLFFSAHLQSYLAAPPSNWLWGKILASLGSNEKYLFIGLTTMVLMVIGWGSELWRRKRPNQDKIFYLVILLLAFILSLGPVIHLPSGIHLPGLYAILFNYVPGFSGMRVPARLAILVLFSASVLAGYGIKEIFGWLENRGGLKYAVIVLVIVVLVFEYISIPLSIKPIKVGKEIPEVYQWLAKQPEDFPIIELPMPPLGPVWYEQTPKELMYVYYSVYHWKKMINGYSGYTAPSYFMIWQEMAGFPTKDAIDLLRGAGVHYIIIHLDKYMPPQRQGMLAEINQISDLQLVKKFVSQDYVYRVSPMNEHEKIEQLQNLRLRVYLPAKEISLPHNSPLEIGVAFRNNGRMGYVHVLKSNFLADGEWLGGGKTSPIKLIPPIPSVFVPASQEKIFIFKINAPHKHGVYKIKLNFRIDGAIYPFYSGEATVNIN